MLDFIVETPFDQQCPNAPHRIIIHKASADIRLGHPGVYRRDKGLDVGPQDVELGFGIS